MKPKEQIKQSCIELYKTKADFNIVDDFAFSQYERLDKKGYGDSQFYKGFDVVGPTRIRINFEWRLKSQVHHSYFEKEIV